MDNKKSKNIISACILIVILLAQTPFLGRVNGQMNNFLEAEENLLNLSREEKKILDQLFELVQKIELMERQEQAILEEVEKLKDQVNSLEEEILKEEEFYRRRQEDLGIILRGYQRNGPTSYFKAILESNSLSVLLRRVNILRTFAHNMGQFLDELEDSREKLLGEKTVLSQKLDEIEEKQKQMEEAIASNLDLKDEMERVLSSMGEAKTYYQNYLNSIEEVWGDLKLTLERAKEEFASIIEKDDLPEDALKISISLSGIRGSIDEETFNDIIGRNTSFVEILFSFKPGKVEMMIPEKNLVLGGKFKILDEHILKFEVMEGSFYDLALEDRIIEELFDGLNMSLSLRPLVGRNKVKSVKVQDGYVELSVKPVL